MRWGRRKGRAVSKGQPLISGLARKVEVPPSEMQSIWVGAGWGQWGGPGPGMGCFWAEIRWRGREDRRTRIGAVRLRVPLSGAQRVGS